MRIYRRAEFLALPAGVFYAKADQRWGFDGVHIKGETVMDVDWYARALDTIETGDADMMDALDEMADTDARYPLGDFVVRDGCFDKGALFLVYERADLETLRGLIDAAMED